MSRFEILSTNSKKTAIMAVLNATPDSFSDGEAFFCADRALEQALLMIAQGADIIDIGGESTRPGAEPVSEEEEMRRVIPIIKALRDHNKEILISIDTTKSKIAEAAIAAGADIINDISAFQIDPDMLKVAVKTQAPCIIMHMRGTPQTMQNLCDYDDLLGEMKDYFTNICQQALKAGVKKENLIIDPGIGFSKTVEQNLIIQRDMKNITSWGWPVLLGPSRKSFIGHVLDKPNPNDRIWGTAAAIAYGISQGVQIIRIHDVAEMVDVARIADAIYYA